MDQNTMIAIAVAVIGFFSFTYVSMQEIFKFRIKKEQIKADALVRAEEIKAKNLLDIEALMYKNGVYRGKQIQDTCSHINEDVYLSERRNKTDQQA